MKCVRSAFSRIHLVDKCLILFMLVLLLQSAYSMFFIRGGDNEASHIDVIVRTASASIFGYFLSANFIRYPTAPKGQNGLDHAVKKIENVPSAKDEHVIHGRMGFGVASEQELEAGGANGALPEEKETIPEGRLQVIAATAIGMFCLITLIILRNIAAGDIPMESSQSAAATVAQFRDFISGCVGFLIGSPTRGGDLS